MILKRLSRAIREQNWFAVVLEICIVVLGVVIGFQVTAWGQARADRSQEQVYLRQLAADLRATEEGIARADSGAIRTDRAGAQLLRAFCLPERPPRDSILAWFSGTWQVASVRPTLGTAEALIATGDLRRLRNDSLHTAVTTYLDDNRRQIQNYGNSAQRWSAALGIVEGWTDMAEALAYRVPQAARDSLDREEPLWPYPATIASNPFALDVEGFLSDRTAAQAVTRMHNSKNTMRGIRNQMRESAVTLREQVDAELNR
jgi:hypothetical protein